MPHPEHAPQPEIDPTLLSAFQAAFIPRSDQYPVQRADGKYITLHQPLTSRHLLDHLMGRLTLGAYALNPASLAHWICWDADDDPGWEGLLRLGQTLEAQGVAVYREISRQGGHLWLFTPPLPGMFARQFARQLLLEQHLEGVEVYPKQDHLVSGPGSLVRLPLGVHRKSGRVYPFVTAQGQPLAATRREQLAHLAYPERLSLPYLLGVLARIPPSPAPPEPTAILHRSRDHAQMPLSERLKASISVLDFVSRYVQLDARHLGLCPFHDDHIKSFGVHAGQNYWHCFAGCGGGSLIDFWMKWRQQQGQDSSFTATVTELRVLLL